MRVLLFTGKGGVGKTTAAAATAALAARRGLQDAGAVHRRRALAGRRAGRRRAGRSRSRSPSGLYVQQVDTQRRFERSWGEVRDYLLTVLDDRRRRRARRPRSSPCCRAPTRCWRCSRSATRCARGAGTSSSSTARRRPRRCGCSPCPRRWAGIVQPVFPTERRVARSLRPVLGRVAGVPRAAPTRRCSTRSAACTRSWPRCARCSPTRAPPCGWC